ncbi:MAG: hypothetical protein CFE22_11135 [Cytophagaceae bacterium BCCC1]|nr:MAG: hypothetical protein CFE22_11135 [Cytophagaceae bacterium BCCC1]
MKKSSKIKIFTLLFALNVVPLFSFAQASCTITSGSICVGEFLTICFNWKSSDCNNPESNMFWFY